MVYYLEHEQDNIPHQSDYGQKDNGRYAVEIDILGFNPGGIGEQYAGSRGSCWQHESNGTDDGN